MDLREYFQEDNQLRALGAFSSFAKSAEWPVHERLEMYEAFAFLPMESSDGEARFQDHVYDVLNSYWQVFRGQRISECWTAQRTFDIVRREFADFAWHRPVTLANLSADQRQILVSQLSSLGTIKPNQGFPIMTASKFLHFFNPALFPIYDEAIVWKAVLEKRFNSEFRQFHVEHSLRYETGSTVNWLGNYIAYANWMVSSAAHPNFMQTFADWLVTQPQCQAIDRNAVAPRLFAMAFEYTMIGAAFVER
ncbi:MAG: hypothetical protein JWN34_1633 [Bryobacterales bacterium]|nr:hypothetical protein [Bryobacterales bacterium]